MSSSRARGNTSIDPIFLYDEEVRSMFPIIAGIDEAGRGPLAGPVVAAAVILRKRLVIPGLRDSKKIWPVERKRIFWDIVRNACGIGVGIVDAGVIDDINILQATRRAMTDAIRDLDIRPDILLIDAVKLPDIDIPQQSIIRAESVSASVAAASVIAKVVRDDIMGDYHEQYPQYNFRRHKGYSTREHMACLNRFGPCPIHRKTFRKVRDARLPFDMQ